MRILITGASGFTGLYLTKLLQTQNYEVFPLRSRLNNKSEIKSEVNKIQPHYVFHLGGLSFAGADNGEELYTVNTVGAENLLKALLHVKTLKKIILTSSATVYGNQNVSSLHENLHSSPVNHYGCSKLAMEFIAQNYFDELPILIVRPFNYTGIGHSKEFVIPKIVNAYKLKEPKILLGNINISREFNDVRDVCSLYLALMKSNISSEVINLCSGNGITLTNVINTLEELSKHQIRIEVNPKFVRKNEMPILVGDNKKIMSLLGEKYQIEYDIKNTLEWMLQTK